MTFKYGKRAFSIWGIFALLFGISGYAVEVLADTSSSPTLESATYFGGAGDQRGTALSIQGGNIFLSGYEGQGSELEALGLKFAAPPGPSPLWSTRWPNPAGAPASGDDYFQGVATTAEGVYFPGASYSQTSDGVGGKEHKSILAKYPLAGTTSPTWVATPHFFPYTGVEGFEAAATALEGGSPVIYAVGGGQPCSYGAYLIGKFDASGNFLAKATDPGQENALNYCSYNGTGSGAAAVTVLNGNVYAVGGRGGNPAIWKHAPNLSVVWRQQDASVASGSYLGVTALGNAIYVVGQTYGAAGSEQYIAARYDESGNRIWSKSFGGANSDVLNGVTAIGSRLFAVGYTRSQGSGGSDGVLMEINPETGDVLSTAYFGGGQDDAFRGVSSNGTDLYVVGESKSYASAAGNAVGQSDLALARYTLGPPALASISVTPSNPTIAVGQTQPFTATGTFSDGSTRTLTSGGTGWAPGAPMPTARSSVQGATVNGLFYAVGGNDGHDTPVVEAYNPATDAWSSVASLNASNYGGDTGRYAGSAVGVNGKVYMMGGWTNSPPLPSNTLSIYNPGTNSWSSGPTIPGSGYTACSEAAAIGSKIYLLNACNGYSGYVQQLSIFDTANNAWTTGPSAPRNHNAGLGAALNGKFYVVGGNDGGYQPQLDVYDPATGAWTTVGSMPVNLWSMAGDVINGKWYIVGGSNPTGNYNNSVWIYDPATNTWTSGPPAPTVRSGAAAAAINGKLYVTGGSNFSGLLNTMEVLDPSADSVMWSSSDAAVASVSSSGLASAVDAGATTITATSNSVSGSTTLTVSNPNRPPVANAGPDQTVEASGPSGAAVTLDGSGSSDPDGDALSYAWTGAFGSASGVSPVLTFALGTHTVTLAVSDGQASSADTAQITVRDTAAPTLSLPADFSAEATGASGATLHYSASAADAADRSPSVNCTPASGSTFALGTTPVSCTATDASGNSASGGFSITVADTTPPLVSVPSPITIHATTPADAAVSYASSVSDAVDPHPSLFCAPASGSEFALGTTTVFCSASDAAGNGATASFTVEVIDSEAPVLSVPAGITASAAGPGGAVVNYTASASDGFDAHPDVNCTPASGSTFPLGTTTVTCTATDHSGNGASASFVVKVVDDVRPVLTVPGSITASATSSAGAIVNFQATATDNVDANPSVSCTPPSGSTFSLGTTPVSCTATDASGNSATGGFSITVVDTTPPLLSVPSPITIYAASPADAVVYYSASASDAVDPHPSLFCSPPSGSSFALRMTTVFCSASDAAGNGATAGFTVRVIDSGAPVLTVPAGITASATGPGGATVSYAVGATDGFDAHPDVSCTPVSGSTFPLGTTTVACTATDHSGNGTSARFTVTVADVTPPALTLPAPITVNATSPAGAVVTFQATATDAVDPNPSVACTPASGSTFAMGTTTVTCTATDASANHSSGSFDVKVVYTFTGFFQPVENPNTLNVVKAGSAVPVKFSLHGNFGLGIFAPGYPRSQVVACDVASSVNGVEETVTAGSSSLSYDASSDQYKYVWKTDKAWMGSCRQLVVKLGDGSFHWANFMLK